MRRKRIKILVLLKAVLPAVIVMICAFPAGRAMSAEGIDIEADKILKSMSSYLAGTKAFSVDADIDLEIVGENGQKFQLSSFATVIMKRPARFYIQRKGMIADAEFIFDGNTLTLYGKNLNVYAQLKVTGSTDDAIRAYERETGIPAPGADLLFADPYASLSSGIKSSAYIGTAYVNGVKCHHLAFRESDVDWQLWVQTGDEPLPMKYVITSKWHTGSPQYEIRFRDWNRMPQIKRDQFTFTVPKGASKLDTMPVNEVGELNTEEGK